MKTKIKIENLYKIFGRHQLNKAKKMLDEEKSKKEILKKTGCSIGINKANFEIYEGEVFVIMGLSGSGKSTILRCLNNLIKPTFGKVIIDGYNVVDMNKNELRKIRREKLAMVFQNFGLLPHRSVLSNVAFGLEIQGIPLQERKTKALEMIKTVGLSGYENNMCNELSGGMQQRVGLARALATNPQILLMDEAFSALDPLIRNNMQDELLKLQENLKKTIVFITHDLDEALKIGDRIAIMKDGNIVQIGTPEEILSNPANSYVKSFVEKVDSSKIITASTIMFNHPERILTPKDGPKMAIRTMRKIGVSYLPVTNSNGLFQGLVDISDVVKANKEGKNNLNEIILEDVPKTLPNNNISELLPLIVNYKDMPIAVVNEKNIFLGILSRASVISELMGDEYITTENNILEKKENQNV